LNAVDRFVQVIPSGDVLNALLDELSPLVRINKPNVGLHANACPLAKFAWKLGNQVYYNFQLIHLFERTTLGLEPRDSPTKNVVPFHTKLVVDDERKLVTEVKLFERVHVIPSGE
jgi:hypothetical protein